MAKLAFEQRAKLNNELVKGKELSGELTLIQLAYRTQYIGRVSSSGATIHLKMK